jgi:hypothetical protein
MLTTYKNPPFTNSLVKTSSYDDHHGSPLKPEGSFFSLLTGEICQKLRLKLKIWKFSPGLVSRGFQGQKSENNNNNNNNKSRRITMFWFSVLRQEYKRMIKYLYLISGW